MKSKNQQSGFTIVELLIVIVVIGILAAITIVAYSGISVRAENAKTIAGMQQYSDGLGMYQAINGVYPIAINACFGVDGITCSQVTDGAATCFGLGGTGTNAGFNAAMTAGLGKMPQLSSQKMNCSGKQYSGGFYYSTDGKAVTIVYYLRGNQPCSTIGLILYTGRAQQDDTTLCTATLPTLP